MKHRLPVFFVCIILVPFFNVSLAWRCFRAARKKTQKQQKTNSPRFIPVALVRELHESRGASVADQGLIHALALDREGPLIMF